MYIYKYKSEPHNNDVVQYEMSRIFNLEIQSQWIFSDQDINPNKSYYINYKIEILCEADSPDILVDRVAELKLKFEGFKIEFVDVKSSVLEYEKRIDYCIQLADQIEGYGQMKNPNVTFVVTKVNNCWYFGKLTRNDRSFENHQVKIHSYSHAMSCELSRTLVNILCGQESPRIIDPCCGIGTVLVEALDLGYQIVGTELIWSVAEKAKQNLQAIGMPDVVTNCDMHLINEQYDASILDIPYGLMSTTTPELQTGLITKCYEISNRLLLISNEEMTALIDQTKWKIKKVIKIPKVNSHFKRYVYILEK